MHFTVAALIYHRIRAISVFFSIHSLRSVLVVRIELVGAPLVSTSVHISLSAASPAMHFLLPRGSLIFIALLNVFAWVSADCSASKVA